VILNDPRSKGPTPSAGGRATLDDLFRRAAARRPHEIALVDPPNREAVTDGAPRRLSYAEADRMISAIAGRLRRIGLHTDAIVGLQMANTVESVLTLLGVLRAGLIAMPLPLLWRRAEAMTALSRVGANALIVHGRIGQTDHVDLALQVAAEIFPVRYVCSFGRNPPDGVIPLDDLYGAEKLDPIPPVERERAPPPGPGAHLAIITWDVSAEGILPVGRNHAELIAGGLAVLLESRIEQDAVILTTLATASFAGLAVSILPWLLVGGTLVLHHPFDSAALAAQRRTMRCDAIVVPGPLVAQFAEGGLLSTRGGLRSVLGVWRAPERLARAPAWRDAETAMIDVHVFGETGLIAARRGPNGKPAAVPFGPIAAPRGATGAVMVAEIMPTVKGTVALRGPMVPRCTFPPGAERTALPSFKSAANGFVDSGYACRIEDETTAMIVTGPPPGMISVGGYRFVMRKLQEVVSGVASDATLAALPDALAGHRLAGATRDGAEAQDALANLGVNPLLVGAFRERRPRA
jgi:non-ribosomal peptide synthetase component E (peptide arylation enzyme)